MGWGRYFKGLNDVGGGGGVICALNDQVQF